MTLFAGRDERTRLKNCCCCIPWRYSSYVAALITLVVQVALSIVFVAYGVYTGAAPLGISFIFHVILFIGLKRKSHRLIAVYLVYSFFYWLLIWFSFGWMVYIVFKGDNNVFFNDCINNNWGDDCKTVSRRLAGWLIAFMIVCQIITSYTGHVLRKYRNYLRWKCTQAHRNADDCCPAPGVAVVSPAPMSQPPPPQQVNVIVQPATQVYPMQPMSPTAAPVQQYPSTYQQPYPSAPAPPPYYSAPPDSGAYPAGGYSNQVYKS